MREEPHRGFESPALPESKRREKLRNDGYRDGFAGREKASTEPEYLTSYRRGKEASER